MNEQLIQLCSILFSMCVLLANYLNDFSITKYIFLFLFTQYAYVILAYAPLISAKAGGSL